MSVGVRGGGGSENWSCYCGLERLLHASPLPPCQVRSVVHIDPLWCGKTWKGWRGGLWHGFSLWTAERGKERRRETGERERERRRPTYHVWNRTFFHFTVKLTYSEWSFSLKPRKRHVGPSLVSGITLKGRFCSRDPSRYEWLLHLNIQLMTGFVRITFLESYFHFLEQC